MKELIIFLTILVWFLFCIALYKVELRIGESVWKHDHERTKKMQRGEKVSFYSLHMRDDIMINMSLIAVYIPALIITIVAKGILSMNGVTLIDKRYTFFIFVFLIIWTTLFGVMYRTGMRKLEMDESADKKKRSKKRSVEYYVEKRAEFRFRTILFFVGIAFIVLVVMFI